MARKKTADPDRREAPAPARRAATGRRPARSSSTAAEPLRAEAEDSVARRDREAGTNPSHPSYQEIAEAAYHRYLSRGAADGADFDDWIAAERELRLKQTGLPPGGGSRSS